MLVDCEVQVVGATVVVVEVVWVVDDVELVDDEVVVGSGGGIGVVVVDVGDVVGPAPAI